MILVVVLGILSIFKLICLLDWLFIEDTFLRSFFRIDLCISFFFVLLPHFVSFDEYKPTDKGGIDLTHLGYLPSSQCVFIVSF